MKTILRAAVVAIAALVSSWACALPSSPGTTAAYADCYRGVRAQGLDDQAIRMFCADRNQLPVNRGLAVQGSPSRNGDLVGFSAVVTNSSVDLVATRYDVSLTTPDGKSFHKIVTGQFLQPGQSQQVYFPGDEIGAIRFTPGIVGEGSPQWPCTVSPMAGLAIVD